MDIIVNHSSMQPIYEQIGDQIKEKIMHGILKADTPLPSVRTLAKELKVSALTVKKAYDALEEEGFVITIHGKGSFVAFADQGLMLEEKKKELEAAEKRIGELSAIFKRLYEDSVSGRISDERFTELSADYEAEQQELKERVARIQAELSKAQEATVNAEKFMNIVRKHMNFEELTHTLLREFVEKIVVHECSYDENGTRRQDIEIYYSFVGKVDLPE